MEWVVVMVVIDDGGESSETFIARARGTMPFSHPSSTTYAAMTYCSCPSDPQVLLYLQMIFDRVDSAIVLR